MKGRGAEIFLFPSSFLNPQTKWNKKKSKKVPMTIFIKGE